MKKTAGQQIMQLVSGIIALLLFAMPPLAAAWQKGEPESERRAALRMLPQLISDAQNSPARQLEVGFLYAQGIEGRPDYAKAVEWYQKAAEAGSNTAMYLLAVMSIEGLGTEQDYAAALRWAQKIADSGDGSGYMLLGMLYESGSGVPQDDTKAAQYYGYATREARDIGARYRLGMLNLEGKGVPKNPARAIEWLESAASQGDRHARYQLGYMYFTGTGVGVDYVRSGVWFEKTLASDGPVTRKKFPDIFGSAAVAGEDYTKRMRQMMKKDPNVKRNANFMLGRIYEKFGETPLNQDCAKAYYAMAAKAGHKDARTRLAAMKKTEREKLKAKKQQEKAAAKEAARQASEKQETTQKPAPVIAAAELKVLPEKAASQPVIIMEKTEISRPTDGSSSMQALTVVEAKNITAPRVMHTAQEMDGIEEVIGILDNPVALVVMDMIGSIMEQGVHEAEDDSIGVVNASGL
ncbi:MAG: sel1 repeat family protein [Oxalobacter sp.]|nr:sel1 repeat family protein [Oxalobacter sp.]